MRTLFPQWWHRLVPFVLILFILEEILPLIVIYAPSMLPSTTILPSQADRIYLKREEKKVEAISTVKWYAEREKLNSSSLSTVGVKGLNDDLAWTMCRFVVVILFVRSLVYSVYGRNPERFPLCDLDLRPSLLTRLLAFGCACRAFELSDHGPRFLVNHRLSKHLAYLAHDDSLLLREDSGARLTIAELRVALSERGL
jgi:LETM1 and EF-hand domain-containing protein 1